MMKKIYIIKRLEKIGILVLCVIAVALVGRYGILAFLADADAARNQLSIGSLQTKITENFDPPPDINPGISFKKQVAVKNIGDSDCYVRVKILFSDSRMEQYCTVDYDITGSWVYSASDGYWYYLQPIASGESTVPVCDKVTINASAPSSALDAFDIIAYQESCQAGNCSDYTEAWMNYLKNQ